jgi:hypothetical protein
VPTPLAVVFVTSCRPVTVNVMLLPETAAMRIVAIAIVTPALCRMAVHPVLHCGANAN